MVNMRGLYSGVVENERQLPVARWSMNRDEYLEVTKAQAKKLTHQQIVALLSLLPNFARETENHYIDFEECVISHINEDKPTHSGYRLTIVTEETETGINSYAYFTFDSYTPEGWQGTLPPQLDYPALHLALNSKFQSI